MEFLNETDKLDQHFLIDKNVINTLINEANLNESDIVVEVGPGKGNISKLIASKVHKLYLIEKDVRLKPFLDNINATVIYGNVLETYIPECDKLITSLPYSIIEPFINKIIKCNVKYLLMITGSNYANNVCFNKVTKLSLLTCTHFKVEKIMDILPSSFEPKPRVLSSMIRLIKIDEKDLNDSLIIFRNLFYYQDKKIKNALIESFIRLNFLNNIKLTKIEAKKIIESLNIDSDILNKKFEIISNQELNILYKKITSFFNEK